MQQPPQRQPHGGGRRPPEPLPPDVRPPQPPRTTAPQQPSRVPPGHQQPTAQPWNDVPGAWRPNDVPDAWSVGTAMTPLQRMPEPNADRKVRVGPWGKTRTARYYGPPVTGQDLIAAIDRPTRDHGITVSSQKGGVGKTSAVLGLGTVLGLLRRDLITAIDANPHRGTLAERLGEEHSRTVQDLVRDRDHVRSSADLRRYLSQARSRLEVIASEKDQGKQMLFTAEEYEIVIDILMAFRPIVITDTGIDLTLTLMHKVFEYTDTLIVPATTAADGYRLATETLTWWAAHAPNGPELVAQAVVPITRVDCFTLPDPHNPPSTRTIRRMAEQFDAEQDAREEALVRNLAGRVRAVIPIPYDPVLRRGHVFEWSELQPDTQDAYLNLAYAVSRSFDEHESTTVYPRRQF